MSDRDRKRLKEIHTFPALVRYLREDLGWPVDQASFDDLDDITFDWEADELGIDPEQAAKIEYIKQLRPLEKGEPQGVFFVKFNAKSLPVVALRRLLGKLVVKKRATANAAERPLWAMRDLVFISSYGKSDERQLSFAYFQEPELAAELPTLKVLGWDDRDTALQLDRVHDQLAAHLTWPATANAFATWRKGWSAAFELCYGEIATTANELADQLAALARGIRKRANQLLALETEKGPLRTLMTAFKTALIHDLTQDQFADMYAQTIAYGLLSARITHPDPVKAETLPDLIPVTNPFLKELMETFVLAGGKQRGRKRGLQLDFDELGINDVVELLRRANMDAVLRNFGADDRKEDPVTYFYEDFLNAYDSKERKRRGVYYTPKPVVSFIVRSVHELLVTTFGLEDGIASTVTWGEIAKRKTDLLIPDNVDPESQFVQILDPATGTATFLVTAIEIIFETLTAKWKELGLSDARRLEEWNQYVPRYLLPRLHGYELMMAPYAIAHLKLGLKLHETGYRFESAERARVYLTNALEPAGDGLHTQIDAFSEALAHEATAVDRVKRTNCFTVIVGNPPYSYMSANLTQTAAQLIEPFRYVDGERIRERSALSLERSLQDDFVKFFGLVSSLRRKTGPAVAFGLITNNSYIESPLHRGVRDQLSKLFSQLYLVNLFGDSIKDKEENVFDIQQGVAILLGTSDGASEQSQVWVCDIHGTRAEKYTALSHADFRNMEFQEIHPSAPQRYFLRLEGGEMYARWHPLSDIFCVSSTCIKTLKDELATDFEADSVQDKIDWFRNSRTTKAHIKERFGIEDVVQWKIDVARAELRGVAIRREIIEYQARPFDYRWMFYNSAIVGSPRYEVMSNLLESGNRALIANRKIRTGECAHFWITSKICVSEVISSADNSNCFPLYIRPTRDGLRLESWRSNFSQLFLRELDDAIGSSYSEAPRDKNGPNHDAIFDYIYAVFHSPSYRSQYAAFLKIEFPRLPLPGHRAIFDELARLGSELAALHLMESSKAPAFVTTYTGPKQPKVGRVGWADNTVWLDAPAVKKGEPAKPGTIGFNGVPEAVWVFHIGGYQACEKWLKDRKGRKLLKGDIDQYQKIVVILSETIQIMKKIDQVIEKHGGWSGAFQTIRPARPS